MRSFPKLWYNKYILNEAPKDEPTESMIIGSIIHCLLGTPELFDKYYTVIGEVPSSKLMLKYLLLKSEGLDLESCKALSGYSDSTSVARVEKEAAKYDDYYQSLLNGGDKTFISNSHYDIAKMAVEAVRKNKWYTEKLLGLNNTVFDLGQDVYKELEVRVDYNEVFGLKGIMDSVVVDHDDKSIYLVDIKTTSKTILDFPKSPFLNDYKVQMAVYNQLLQLHFKELGYEIKSFILVIDRES